MKRKLLLILTASMTLIALAQDRPDFYSLKGNINLMVVSDLGRNGYYDQRPIAELMGLAAEQTSLDAVLALGDTHHYLGVQSVDDPLWLTNYELIYSHPELQVAWHPVLGNHEYRGNTQAVIGYSGKSRRWDMPAQYYTKTFKGGNTTLKVVFIDTTPLINKYKKKGDTYPDAGKQDVEEQLQWLNSTLSDVTEDWIIVVGHHPIYAYTDKDNSERKDMQERVDRILRKHKVDMYVCGHIHNFQHLRHPDCKIDYVVNSSGSLSRTAQPIKGTQFCSDSPGFSFLSATPTALNLYMINTDGQVIHTVKRETSTATQDSTGVR